MCKISVITPVYKVEKYLRKCIDSVLAQTFTDFELFIVDDGSPDNCGKIADEYEKKDSRVKVIHKENGGAPSARNAGMELAKGEYYYFPDSDDWLEPTYLEELYKTAVNTKAQLVISGFVMEYYEKDSEQSYAVFEEKKVFNNKQEVRDNIHYYFNNMMMAVPWNKLYKADYIRNNHLKYPDLKWDDLHFNMEVIMNIDKVAISNSKGYHFFRSRQGSETTSVFDGLLYQKRKEQFEHIMKVYKYWDIKDKDILAVIYGYYSSRLVQCVQEIAINKDTNKRKLIKNIVEDQLTIEAMKNGKIDSKLLYLSSLPIKFKNVTACILAGKLIGFVKIHMSPFFYKIKAKTVNKAIEIG